MDVHCMFMVKLSNLRSTPNCMGRYIQLVYCLLYAFLTEAQVQSAVFAYKFTC